MHRVDTLFDYGPPHNIRIQIVLNFAWLARVLTFLENTWIVLERISLKTAAISFISGSPMPSEVIAESPLASRSCSAGHSDRMAGVSVQCDSAFLTAASACRPFKPKESHRSGAGGYPCLRCKRLDLRQSTLGPSPGNSPRFWQRRT